MSSSEEQLKKEKVRYQMLEHYETIFDKMVRWCIFEQEPQLDVTMKAFGLKPKDLTIQAMETVLKKYKGDTDG